MLIVVAGMKRSGTTWMYNVVRVALVQAGVDVVLCRDSFHCWRQNRDKTVLVKSHWWRDVPADVILTSGRDPSEVRESMTHLLGRPITDGEMNKIVRHARKWQKQSDYHMPYERLLSEPLWVVTEIIEVLEVEADPEEVLSEVESLSLPEKGQDPSTLYFANHRRPQ